MIISAQGTPFVPKGSSRLITKDGFVFVSLRKSIIRKLHLNGNSIKRVYSGDQLVFEQPTSYFYLIFEGGQQ